MNQSNQDQVFVTITDNQGSSTTQEGPFNDVDAASNQKWLEDHDAAPSDAAGRSEWSVEGQRMDVYSSDGELAASYSID